mmetsp:Transcript_33519/g.96316  ORF Transcript_33519/g.96316 Transcript_33519/m.96316 type:complete len:130 (-) Transcript_33519:173-562(-)
MARFHHNWFISLDALANCIAECCHSRTITSRGVGIYWQMQLATTKCGDNVHLCHLVVEPYKRWILSAPGKADTSVHHTTPVMSWATFGKLVSDRLVAMLEQFGTWHTSCCQGKAASRMHAILKVSVDEF